MTEPQTTSQDNQYADKERRARRWVLLSEIGLVGATALVFLLFLTVLIGIYFPEGSALVGDYEDQATADLDHDRAVQLQIDAKTGEATRVFVGELVSLRRRVQRRGGNSLAWQDAELGDTFVRNDAVQTFARSTALLAVNDDSYLTVGENSLIIFDNREADPFLHNQQSILVMVDGELSGTLLAGDDSRLEFGVRLPNSDVTLVSDTPGGDVDFLITVNDDQSTTLNLIGGAATIVDANGQSHRIAASESATIDPTGANIRVSRLPPTPSSVGPRNRAVVRYRNVPEAVRFDWQPVRAADRYHLVVARDANLVDRLVDDEVTGTSFTHGALSPGQYYWQVRSRREWAQSAPSVTQQLSVEQDVTAPVLQLDQPESTVAAGAWRLSGRTEPDATVFIDGQRISNHAGVIDEEIALRRGANIITVKAVDSVGNLSYASLAIKAK